ncbi:SRPBCC family protein [Streptomyces sp. YIM 130001]|uniref:aromatase/cyclase n=1 Tax=Streptomyces sp. YIM 130001 TaxID=2259644 RepID=UPI001F08DADE|nr:SRPBCC family protein [Streptomyces sp. YIM 130001]
MKVDAPAGVVYALIADADKWPLYFSTMIHVEQLEFDGERERLRMWSQLGGQLKSWIAYRHLDPLARRVQFWQELPAPPIRSLGGTLNVYPDGPRNSTLNVYYDYSVVDDQPESAEWARLATERHTRTQLGDIKDFAELWYRLDDLMLTFEDSVRINGPAELAYDLLYRAGDWPEHVPHIARTDLTEDTPGIQELTSQILCPGGPYTTEAVRICFPHAGRIVHKHTTPGPLLSARAGEWSVVPDETGVTVTSHQRVLLDEEHARHARHEHGSLAALRRQVRDDLGGESRTLLDLARRHAETAVRML